jgi:hypothetical protein
MADGCPLIPARCQLMAARRLLPADFSSMSAASCQPPPASWFSALTLPSDEK